MATPDLEVVEQGQGPALVLGHALGVDLRMWDELADDLARDHLVLRYDHRGQGASDVPPGPYTMEELVDDAAALIRERGIGPVVYVGLSMGGMVAMGLAVRHPELVRGIVVANSGAKYPDAARATWAQRIAVVESQGMAAVADGTMERWFTPAFRATRHEVVDRFRHTVLQADPAGYVATCRAIAAVDWLDRLPGVSCPALVIAGALDAGAPPEFAQAIAGRIPGAELQLWDDVAHMSAIEQPARFIAAVRVFLVERCGG
jgi:3-oxoadipate enol-lactonase